MARNMTENQVINSFYSLFLIVSTRITGKYINNLLYTEKGKIMSEFLFFV
jgi:hypothetical protein